MNLLECLVAIAVCILLIDPLIKTSSDLLAKHLEYEKKQFLVSEAERAFELIGRAIRIAGYRNIHSQRKHQDAEQLIQIQKENGYQESDSLTVYHELSAGVDFDCIGNVLNAERTKHGLARQGFLVDRQSGFTKGSIGNGGSLICQSLDRQGRLQNTTLMNGVSFLSVEEIQDGNADSGQKIFKVGLQMTDGARLKMNFERTFSSRNLP